MSGSISIIPGAIRLRPHPGFRHEHRHGPALVDRRTVDIGSKRLDRDFCRIQRYIKDDLAHGRLWDGDQYYQRAVASSNRIEGLLAVKTDVPEPESPLYPKSFDHATKRTPGKIEFKDLCFRFPGTENPVLRNITLTIEAGERVAFVGTIGAGKTALLSLLPRLYPVQRGMVFVDEVDVNDWPLDELRRQVGFVSQDVFLFSGTVEENLTFGFEAIPPESAARAAAIHDDVLRMPGAYSTLVGERGSNLSGG